jgi:hypothetical protein
VLLCGSVERLPRLNSNARKTVVFLIPFIILAVDFCIFPRFFETHTSKDKASLVSVLARRSASLGIFRAHRILVSVDNVQEFRNSALSEEGPNALVISAFVQEDRGQGSSASGALLSAVLAKLKGISLSDYLRLKNKFGEASGIQTGQVFDFELSIPKAAFASFPINHLLVITFPWGHADADAEDLDLGIPKVLEIAKDKRIQNLVIPCLGTNWEKGRQRDAVSLTTFFNSFFKGLPLGDRPRNIYLSLYEQWPSIELEDAFSVLSSDWQQQVVQDDNIFPIYRRDFRLTICFLEVCLVVCSWQVKFTIQNVLIVAVGFVGLALEIDKWVVFLVQRNDPNSKLIIQICILMVLSAGFPFIARLSLGKLFGGE